MYSFCVNLYKYVNSTGIADGLFDWLLKCCYTTLAWKTTLSQRRDGEEQSFEIESKTSDVEGVTKISNMGKNNVFFRKRVGTLRKIRRNEKKSKCQTAVRRAKLLLREEW